MRIDHAAKALRRMRPWPRPESNNTWPSIERRWRDEFGSARGPDRSFGRSGSSRRAPQGRSNELTDDFLQTEGAVQKMMVSTLSAEHATMTPDDTNSPEKYNRKPHPIMEWLKRETRRLFPDLRLAWQLIRATSADLRRRSITILLMWRLKSSRRILPTEGIDHGWVWEYAKFQFEARTAFTGISTIRRMTSSSISEVARGCSRWPR